MNSRSVADKIPGRVVKKLGKYESNSSTYDFLSICRFFGLCVGFGNTYINSLYRLPLTPCHTFTECRRNVFIRLLCSSHLLSPFYFFTAWYHTRAQRVFIVAQWNALWAVVLSLRCVHRIPGSHEIVDSFDIFVSKTVKKKLHIIVMWRDGGNLSNVNSDDRNTNKPSKDGVRPRTINLSVSTSAYLLSNRLPLSQLVL